MARVDIGFGQMMNVVGALHGGVGVGVIRARLKYFQRIGFPPSPDIFVGVGERARYDADSLLKLVLAFELLAAGVAPKQAAALVGAGWTGTGPSLAGAWLGRDDRGPYAPVLLIARVDGLESKKGGVGAVEARTEAGLRIWAQAQDAGDRRLLVIEAVQVARALAAALLSAVKLDVGQRMRRGLDEWAGARAAPGAAAYGT